MHQKWQVDAFRARLIAHGAGVAAVADKRVTVEGNPLAAILLPMMSEPFLFRHPVGNVAGSRNIRDCQENMLFFLKGQRFEGPQETILENRFRLLCHYLILPR
jgi:hypothetical protein